ncbi:MAG TPA: (Fe-S)-binding protein [Humisphaera sp.]|jgi:L-lactate dehydrogenase complex protein LldE|nr:(Fe-S)-binding protein [Humisphaera sp.]
MPHNVALFITCLTDQFYPRVGVAVTKILEHFGCSVSFPQNQTCCGQPFFNNGFHPEARELVKGFIRVFEGHDYIVTPSGSCCSMVRGHFSELLDDDPMWGPRAKQVAARTYEFVEFLDKVLKIDASSFSLPTPTTLTYHYICHLRGIGVKDEGVRFLKQIGNVDFRPMEKTDQCCGFGGTFAIKYPAISGAIVEDKMKCVAATGAKTLICNDAGCTMNISGMCHRHGLAVQTRHIAELLAEAMGLDAARW